MPQWVLTLGEYAATKVKNAKSMVLRLILVGSWQHGMLASDGPAYRRS